MAAISHLFLLGNSVFLAGIKAQLGRVSALELITLESVPADVARWARLYRPQALLFDLSMEHPDFVVALLREQPGLLLLGVDPNSNELLVLSGHPQQALSVSDLVQIIQQKSPEK